MDYHPMMGHAYSSNVSPLVCKRAGGNLVFPSLNPSHNAKSSSSSGGSFSFEWQSGKLQVCFEQIQNLKALLKEQNHCIKLLIQHIETSKSATDCSTQHNSTDSLSNIAA